MMLWLVPHQSICSHIDSSLLKQLRCLTWANVCCQMCVAPPGQMSVVPHLQLCVSCIMLHLGNVQKQIAYVDYAGD